jgi:hypothetical protein
VTLTVSASRTIAVYPPTGGSTSPLRWPTGQPDDLLDYALDYSAWLADVGDTIAGVTVQIAPSSNGDWQPVSVGSECGLVVVFAAYGFAGRDSMVKVVVTTAAGRRVTTFVQHLTSYLLACSPPAPTPVPGYGPMLSWPPYVPVGGPAVNLPPLTVAATGTNQLTAALIPYLSVALVNAGAGGGVVLGVQASQWNGQQQVVSNQSGGTVTIYPFSGDQFNDLGANVGYALNDTQSVTLSVMQSGAILIR